MLTIPTESIGSIPRPLALIEAVAAAGDATHPSLVAPINPHNDTPEEVRDHVLDAAEYIPVTQLGMTDSPFSDDASRTRETAFAKIRARVLGTALAGETLDKR